MLIKHKLIKTNDSQTLSWLLGGGWICGGWAPTHTLEEIKRTIPRIASRYSLNIDRFNDIINTVSLAIADFCFSFSLIYIRLIYNFVYIWSRFRLKVQKSRERDAHFSSVKRILRETITFRSDARRMPAGEHTTRCTHHSDIAAGHTAVGLSGYRACKKAFTPAFQCSSRDPPALVMART